MSKTYKKYKGKRYPDKDAKNRLKYKSCLNHGGCSYCLNNRMHKHNKHMIIDDDYDDEEDIDRLDRLDVLYANNR